MTTLPTTRIPDPGEAPPLRWGILAPGNIAASFTDTVTKHTRQRVVAVGSRTPERAQEFADRFRAKNTKAAQAQSKLKQIERMDKIEAPERDNRAAAQPAHLRDRDADLGRGRGADPPDAARAGDRRRQGRTRRGGGAVKRACSRA